MVEKLISVMYVDDENIYHKEMERIFQSFGDEFWLTCMAKNGKEALDVFAEYHPDIIITDVQMPVMDGIEFCREVRSMDKTVKIIFLTVFDEMEYVRSALRLSVCDYILKHELTEEVLYRKLKELSFDIANEKLTQKKYLQSMVYDMFTSSEQRRKILKENRSCNQYLISDKNKYIIVERDCEISLFSGAKENGAEDDEILRNFERMYEICTGCFKVNYAQTLLVLRTDRDEEWSLIQDMLSTVLNTSVPGYTLYVLNRAATILELCEICEKNKEIFSVKYFFGCGGIYDLEREYVCRFNENNIFDEKVLSDFLVKQDEEGARKYIEAVFLRLLDSLNYQLLLSVYQSFFYFFRSFIRSYFPNESVTVEKIEHCMDMLDVQHWVSDMIAVIMSNFKREPSVNYSASIRKAIRFMKENYENKDLTIEMIAQNVFLSSSRIRTLFKKETGITINKYLTDIRLEKAKELLKNTNLYVYEIAENVGYGSPQYFSQVMFSSEGLMPSQYRRKVQCLEIESKKV